MWILFLSTFTQEDVNSNILRMSFFFRVINKTFTHLLNYLISTVFTSSFIRYFLFSVKSQKFYVIKAFQQKEKK